MTDVSKKDEAEEQKALDILESNFKECLQHLHRYITLTLVIALIYLAVVISPQALEVPGIPVTVEGEFALALLAVLYVAVGAMATYVAERANAIAAIIGSERQIRFKALILHPSIGTTTVPIVRLLVSFVPASIFTAHLAYVGYKASNGGVFVPIIFFLSVGITLWHLLPVGKGLRGDSKA